MLETFLTFIGKQELIRPGDKILLTVSGGVDSMVMTDLFLRAGYRFSIAHCNFNLRGVEADADEALVKNFAKARDIPFYIRRFETQQFARESGISIQMAARQLRNQWFESLMELNDFDVYAVAHHLNDSLETFLFNLTKGTGIAGLHGIQLKNGHIIRPLLFATRTMIRKYAKERSLDWREDRSNASVKYHRNRIRHQVIPALKKINPNLEQTFASTLKRIGAVEDIFQSYIRNFRKQAVAQKRKELWIEIEKINNAPGAVAVLYELIRSYQFNYEQADLIIRGLPGRPGRLYYSSTHVLNIDRSHLIISPVKNRQETEGLAIDKEVREIVFGTVRLSFEVISLDDVSFETDKKIAMLDYDALHFPLLIRKWRYGDFFVPLGMRGKKKLSDFMIDEKIPVNLKTDVLVLLSEGQVAWVVNHRIDERFKVNTKTKRILKIMSNAHD